MNLSGLKVPDTNGRVRVVWLTVMGVEVTGEEAERGEVKS